MKARKILIILFLIIINFSVIVQATELPKIDNEDRSGIILNAFETWVEEFTLDTVSENRRITEYKLHTVETHESNEKRISASIRFGVNTVSENTEWKKENYCYLEMENVDGEYKVTYVSEVPNGYEDFVKEFEKYKKENHSNNINTADNITETLSINNENEEINKISNIVITISTTVLFFMIIIFVVTVIKKRKNKNK